MFKQFSKTINDLPIPAVRPFIGRIHEVIENGLLYKRIEETWDVQSVLCFCQFMDSIFEDDVIFPLDGLPVQHVAFYGKVLTRLVDAGELPAAVKTKFDAVFSSGFLRSLTSCQTLSEDVRIAGQHKHPVKEFGRV